MIEGAILNGYGASRGKRSTEESRINDISLPLPTDLRAGAYYSKGAYGRSWGVRQVTGHGHDAQTGEEIIRFKGIAGICRRKDGQCPLVEFRKWVRYEVTLNENSWQRSGAMVDSPESES